MTRRHRVFVSSSYEDLKAERQAAMEAILRSNGFPAGMEMFPAGVKMWELIKREIDDSDYFVLIIGNEYGSRSEDDISYTEQEYNYALSMSKPVLVFLSTDAPNAKKRTRDGKSLAQFRERVKRKSGDTCAFFNAPSDLRGDLLHSLEAVKRSSPRSGWVRAEPYMTDAVTKTMADIEKMVGFVQEKEQKRGRQANLIISYDRSGGALGSMLAERLGVAQVLCLHRVIDCKRDIMVGKGVHLDRGWLNDQVPIVVKYCLMTGQNLSAGDSFLKRSIEELPPVYALYYTSEAHERARPFSGVEKVHNADERFDALPWVGGCYRKQGRDETISLPDSNA